MLLELDLMVVGVTAMQKTDTCRELVRLGNFLERLKVAVALSEGERLPSTVGATRLDRQRRCVKQRLRPLGTHAESRRDTILEYLQLQYTVAGVDPFRLGSVGMPAMTMTPMVMVAVVVIRMAVVMTMGTVIVGVMAVARAKVVVAVPIPPQLSHKVIETEKDQSRTRDPGKDVAAPFAGLDAKPDDKSAENRGEKDMTQTTEGDDHQCFRLAPTLSATG